MELPRPRRRLQSGSHGRRGATTGCRDPRRPRAIHDHDCRRAEDKCSGSEHLPRAKLMEMGVDRKLSASWQRAASISEGRCETSSGSETANSRGILSEIVRIFWAAFSALEHTQAIALAATISSVKLGSRSILWRIAAAHFCAGDVVDEEQPSQLLLVLRARRGR